MKAAVVGSGVAGLAAALRLNNLGYSVTVFEKNSFFGGKLASFEKGGYRFDKGPSLFTLPNLMNDLFVLYGKNPSDYFNYKDLNIACNYFDKDYCFSAPTNPQNFGLEVEKQFGISKEIIVNYLNDSKKLLELSDPMFISDNKSFLNFSGLKMVLNATKYGVFSKLNDFNKKKLEHPFLVKIFNRFATYNGSNPYLTPGILSCIAALEHNSGAYFPVGGMVQIPKSLIQLATENGVDFKSNSSVSDIKKNNQIWEVTVNDEIHKFDVVVFNGDYYSFKNIGKSIKTAVNPENKNLSTSALVFYWGIKGDFPELNVHNIFFADDYKAEFTALNKQTNYIQDPTIYVHISSKVEPNDAPKGSENWFVLVNVPPGDLSEANIQDLRRSVIKKLNKQLNIDLEQLIEVEENFTPQLIQSTTSSFKGALYGLNSNGIANIFKRPKNKSSEKGLYFVGGTVFPGGGIPLCLNSAKIAVKQIKKDFNINIKHA